MVSAMRIELDEEMEKIRKVSSWSEIFALYQAMSEDDKRARVFTTRYDWGKSNTIS